MNKKQQITDQEGFSLLEILVAFSIMALSIGILLSIFSKGIHTATLSEEYTTAVQIAESLLAKVGTANELVEGQFHGTQFEKYQWTITNYPYDIFQQHNIELGTKSAFKNPPKVVVFQVIVKVAWSDSGDENERYIELNTLKYSAEES
jgi:general secretion pathway protein I